MSNDELEIRVNLVKDESSKVKAYASVSFNIPGIGKYAVNHIKVVEGKNGLFISNPAQEKKQEGSKSIYYDHHHPCTKEGREAWSARIMAAFEERLGQV